MEIFKIKRLNFSLQLWSRSQEGKRVILQYSIVFSQYFTVFTFPSKSPGTIRANLQRPLVVMLPHTLQLLLNSHPNSENTRNQSSPVRSSPVQSQIQNGNVERKTMLFVHIFRSVQFIHRTTTKNYIKSQKNCKLRKYNGGKKLDTRCAS